MKQLNSFELAIQTYLEDRAKKDTLFAVTFSKPGKSVVQCCAYIIGEAKKRGNAVVMTNEEVFGMAVHYYDEDDIKVVKMPKDVKTLVNNAVLPSKVKQEQKPKKRITSSDALQLDDSIIQLNLFS